jgi:hypothetical protein
MGMGGLQGGVTGAAALKAMQYLALRLAVSVSLKAL